MHDGLTFLAIKDMAFSKTIIFKINWFIATPILVERNLGQAF